ncbi:hypothetical protein ACH5RR_025724 [Cinchona calisaya]|uniref:DDE Tnp4 domain-containing protein n=1 Tax=Cinchona calisaya TaxID=153742 RepID=A0ABD2Z3N5_9GENT
MKSEHKPASGKDNACESNQLSKNYNGMQMAMNSDDENATIIGAATSVLATGPHGLRVPQDKYYLVDADNGICNGFIPPYHGVRYHLKEYDDNPPQNEKELFNLHHSSLRATIERSFGILKKRFRVLDNDPFWKYKTEVDMVLACCILHNHIVGVELEPNDTFMEEKNPTHDKYINKKIDMYNEMALVVGKDLATGSFAKGFIDVRLDILTNMDDTMDNTKEVPMEKDIPSLGASTFGHKTASLYAELMKMKGYDDEFLAAVFHHLVQNEMLVMAFMAKSEKLPRISLDNFKKEKDLAFCA